MPAFDDLFGGAGALVPGQPADAEHARELDRYQRDVAEPYESGRAPAIPSAWFPHRQPRRRVRPPPYEVPMDISIDFSRPPTNGLASAAEAHERTVRELADRTTFRYTVAPQCAVHLPEGRTLTEGQELTLQDVNGSPHAISKLQREGVIITLDDATVRARQPPPGDRDRFRVHPDRKGSIIGRGTVLPSGTWLATDGADFATIPGCDEVPPQPARLSERGQIVPAHPGMPKLPELTGVDQLRMLLERQLIIDTRPDEPPPWAESLGSKRKSS